MENSMFFLFSKEVVLRELVAEAFEFKFLFVIVEVDSGEGAIGASEVEVHLDRDLEEDWVFDD